MALLLAYIRVSHRLRLTPVTASRVDTILLFPEAGLLLLINPSSNRFCKKDMLKGNQTPVLETI